MTVALGTNIANPISTALSQWPGFDMMGKLANYGMLGVTDHDAAIKALFANDEQGAWYDPSDLSTMFQDSAGVTPVTADGQPVGKILDKSGRGNHATQATAASRPLYKTDGTYSWLQFDGVDDSLSTAAINFTGTNKMSAFAGLYRAEPTNTNSAFGSGNWNIAGRFECFLPFDATRKATFGWRGNVGFSWRDSLTAALNAPIVLTGVINGDGTTTATEVPIFNINTVLQTTVGGSGLDNTINFSSSPIYLGARDGNSLYLNGRIYSLIVRGALSTTQQITDTETWINGKTGAWA